MIFKNWMTLAIILFGTSPLFAASLSDPMRPIFPSANTTQNVSGSTTTPSRKKFPRLSIESITIIGAYQVIQVNGKSLKLGDIIRGAKLIEIMNDKALFSFQGKQYLVQTKNQKAQIIPLDQNIEGTE